MVTYLLTFKVPQFLFLHRISVFRSNLPNESSHPLCSPAMANRQTAQKLMPEGFSVCLPKRNASSWLFAFFIGRVSDGDLGIAGTC